MMQDLDFEELDKAVNSLMPQSSDNSLASAQPVAVSTPVQPVAKPAFNLKPINRPVTGRFMDVVHPSSDMRSSLGVPQRSLSPSLAPTQTVQPQPTPTLPPENKPTTGIDNWAGLPNYQAPASALESPFLPDMKVEKRPLGAFSNEANIEELLLPEKTDSSAEPVKVSDPVKIPEISPIPAELDESILGVEPDSSTHKNDIEMNNNPLGYTAVNGSINQQYAEKPSLAKPVTGSIYDTSAYNTTAAKPIKKKSSWMMIVWIIILLIVGVGAGLAFYYFMPNFKLPF